MRLPTVFYSNKNLLPSVVSCFVLNQTTGCGTIILSQGKTQTLPTGETIEASLE